MSTETQGNLAIWDAVRTPDPSYTRQFNRGGFKGTTTNVVYLIRCATELWGPMGGRWGIEVVDERVLQGAPIFAAKDSHVVVAHESVHTIRIALRHPDGVVPGIGQTTLVGVNKHGPFTDEEAPKKSLTDALSKAFSWLGFAADIHMGLFDDVKYVNDVKRRLEDERAAEDARGDAGDAVITDAQAKQIRELSALSGADESSLLTWVSGRAGFSVATLEAVPAAAFDTIYASLNKRATSKTSGTHHV